MKQVNACFKLVVLLCILVGQRSFAQPWDYLDVKQGYETLNLAIEGDTTAAGLPKSQNRVYRLERGGTYIINGYLVNTKGAPMRVFAADGTGPKPLIIVGVDQTGASSDFGRIEAFAHFKNLYISGADMLGNYVRYTMAVYNDRTKLILDGLNIDATKQSHIRTYGTNTKIFFSNCELRNSFDLASSGNGRFFDARALMADSIVWQNNTFYVNAQRVFRMDGAIVKNVIFDHNTFYLGSFGSNTSSGTKQSGPIETGKGINVQITNNVFRDLATEAMRCLKSVNPPDRIPIVHVDSVKSADFPESSRNWVVRNNAYGWSPQFKAFWATIDSVKAPEFIGPYGKSAFFNGTKPNFVESNNFEELIQFADAPSPDSLLKYVKYRYSSKFAGVNPPDPRADRSGVGALSEKPETFGPEKDPYNFDYPTTQKAYTAGDGGYPLGDLNWFPAKKAAWLATDVEAARDAVVTDYVLEQNYPNPFNPTTQIHYSLPKVAKVTIAIYNAIGQKIVTLLDNQQQPAGKHSITWNGKDASSGKIISSGVYYYQLKAGDYQITKKMLLVK